MIKPAQYDKFTKAYIECALWSSTDNSNEQGGEPLDKNYNISDISAECLQTMKDDCKAFQETYAELLQKAWTVHYNANSQAGHDFWLTRNHHGTGFWDRGLGEVGQKLTDAAHTFGEFNFYIGDDGSIYGQ